MCGKNLEKWLERIAHANRVGKFDVPKDISELPCGCSRFIIPDISGKNFPPRIQTALVQARAGIQRDLFVYRASLEFKLKCGSCDAEL